MSERLRQAIPIAVGLVLFFAALEVLRVELHAVRWQDLSADILRTPPSHLALALALTFLNYLALTGSDPLAFAYVGKTLPRVRIAVEKLVRLSLLAVLH